jgi:hypothetical protein
MGNLLSYRPGSFYFRYAARNEVNLEQVKEHFYLVRAEHIKLCGWASITMGFLPQRFFPDPDNVVDPDFGCIGSLRSHILHYCDRWEELRAWLRGHGVQPPGWALPPDKVRDICREPVTDFERALAEDCLGLVD